MSLEMLAWNKKSINIKKYHCWANLGSFLLFFHLPKEHTFNFYSSIYLLMIYCSFFDSSSKVFSIHYGYCKSLHSSFLLNCFMDCFMLSIEIWLDLLKKLDYWDNCKSFFYVMRVFENYLFFPKHLDTSSSIIELFLHWWAFFLNLLDLFDVITIFHPLLLPIFLICWYCSVLRGFFIFICFLFSMRKYYFFNCLACYSTCCSDNFSKLFFFYELVIIKSLSSFLKFFCFVKIKVEKI